jgi:hemoglobin
MLDRVYEWVRFLRPTTLWWELTYYPYKYGVPRGWSATDLLAEIDKTWVDGDSTNQLRIHEIGTIVHLSVGKEPDKPVIMEMGHSATERTDMQTLYEAAGGHDGLLRLASAWHTRVLKDEVVSHAFSHGYHPQHTERLAAYWAEALGGPTTYSDQYGDETSVVRIHSGNGPHEEMDQRAIACFDQALEDVGLARDERLRRVLLDYFAWATTTTMSRYHHSAEDVPNGLHIPMWSWHGLARGEETDDT